MNASSQGGDEVPMADSDSDYRAGPGRPPLHTRFKGR